VHQPFRSRSDGPSIETVWQLCRRRLSSEYRISIPYRNALKLREINCLANTDKVFAALKIVGCPALLPYSPH